MWAKTLVVVCLCVPFLVLVKASPNAAKLNNIFDLTDARYSNNIVEDANLDVPELVRKYQYPLEVHHVTTEDGYILEMHRIPYGRDQNNVYNENKPIIFLMHGLLSSSADWVLMGPGSGFGVVCGDVVSRECVYGEAFAFPIQRDRTPHTTHGAPRLRKRGLAQGRSYILAEEGYDIWMGNARGNYYSRRHLTLNPDGILNTKFWEFSWDEIGNIDLPTMIDYALEYTGQSRLHYIGHSQGTTAFFVMGSLRPDYNEKIISMHALAPVAYMANNRNPLLWYISPYATNIEKIASLIGIGEFLPNNAIMTWAGQSMCKDEVLFQPICSNILFLIGGWNEAQHNATMMPVIFGHTPAGSSVRQLAHYGQSIADKRFRRYDQGTRRANRRKYGSSTPPSYDLSKVTTPVFLHYSDNDPLAHVRDVDTLFKQLGRPIGKFLVQMAKFSHLDFMWGIDAKELVYDRVINLVKAMDINGFDDRV